MKMDALIEDQIGNKNIEIIKEGLLNENVCIATIQLVSPFYGELGKSIIGNNYMFTWKENVKNREDKIIGLIDEILKIGTVPKPHILIFPEYSIPWNFKDTVKKKADENGIIIIGGSYVDDFKDEKFRKNVGIIFIPKEELKFLEKSKLSPYEKEYVAQGRVNENNIKIFYTIKDDESKDKTICIEIVLCLDYIYNFNKICEEKNPGALISVMCSGKISMFTGFAEAYMQMGEGKFIVLCNAANVPNISPLIEGCSKVMGSSKSLDKDGSVISLSKEEGVLITKLNLLRPYVRAPTQHKGSIPDPVLSKDRYRIVSVKDGYKLVPWENEKLVKMVGIINPLLIQELGKSTRFDLIMTKAFGATHPLIQKTKTFGLKCRSVIGDQDILIEQIDGTILDKEILSDEVVISNIEIAHCAKFFVTKYIFRYKGIEINEYNKIKMRDIIPEEIRKAIDLTENWDVYDDNIKNNLINKKIILGFSPIFDLDASGKILAYIFLEISQTIPGEGEIKNFVSNVITPIVIRYKDAIKTVYRGHGEGISANFLIESFSDPHTIFKEIIYSLHDLAHKSEIGYFRTHTYPVVEEITEGSLEFLLHPVLDHTHTKIRDDEIFKFLSNEEKSNMKKFPQNRQNEIIDVFSYYVDIVDLRTELEDLIKFMITQNVESVSKTVPHIVGSKIDTYLKKNFIEKYLDKYKDTEEDRQKIGFKKFKDPITTYEFGPTIDCIKLWAEKGLPEILPSSDLQNLFKVNEIRNYYEHRNDRKTGKPKDPPKPEDVESALIFMFEFIKRQKF